MNRDLYLNKVIEFIVQDTEIDYERDEIFTPFDTSGPYRHNSFFFDKYLPVEHWSPFSQYCHDTYGLSGDEISYVRSEYRNIILDKINNKGSINESVDRMDLYLDKVLEFLIEDTYLNLREENIKSSIKLPFYENNIPVKVTSGVGMYDLLAVLTDVPWPSQFYRHCKDMYGLDKDSVRIVWERYRRYLIDLVTKNRENI